MPVLWFGKQATGSLCDGTCSVEDDLTPRKQTVALKSVDRRAGQTEFKFRL